jgi:O-antigen/teichoic acid export membrane protein
MSSNLAKETAIYGMGALLTKSMAFLLIPLYTQFLSVAEYGALALLNQILNLGSFMTLMGVSSGSMRFFHADHPGEEYQRELYGSAVMLLMVLPPLVAILLGGASFPLFERFIPSLPFFPLVVIVFVTCAFTPLLKLLTGFMRIQQRPVAFIVITAAFFLVQTTLIVVAVGFLGLGLKGQLYSQLLANIVFWVVALFVFARYSRPRFSRPIFRRLLVFGIPMIPFFFFAWINTAAGRFMLERFGSLDAVGIFSLASQFSGIVLMFAVAFDNALLPHFFRVGDQPNGPVELGRLVVRYLAFFGILSLCVNIAAPPVISIVANPDYHEAIRYVSPLTLSVWLFVCTKPVTWSLMHQQKTGALSRVHAISAVVLVGFLLFFLAYLDMGIPGIIASIVLANVFTVMLGYRIAQADYRLEIPWVDLVVSVGTLIAGGYIIAIIPGQPLELMPLLLRLLVFAVVAGISVYRLDLYKFASALRRRG